METFCDPKASSDVRGPMALTEEHYQDTCSVLAKEREKQVEDSANREKEKRALVLCPGM